MTSPRELAIVTGASSGIGRAVSIELSREPVTVLAVGRNEQRLAETVRLSPGKVVPIIADVSNASGRNKVIEAAAARPVRCLVHLAGEMPITRLIEMDSECWERVFATHVHARLYLSIGLLQNLSPGGRIIFVGSMSASKARKGAAVYCTSYAASMMLAACLKLELSEHDVDVVNAVPGAVSTPLLESAINSDVGVFPDSALFRQLRESGNWTRLNAVAKFFKWLAVYAEREFLMQNDTVDIANDEHHEQWLGAELLFQPGSST